MHSTLKLRDSDPHDDFALAPDAVPAAWADKVLADIKRDAGSQPDANYPATDLTPIAASGGTAAAPTVDTTFRATAIDDIPAPAESPSTSRWAKSAVMLVLAIGSAAAAAAWQNHGDTAKQMFSNWVPTFALTSSPTPETAALAAPTDAPPAEASAAEQTTPQPAAPAPLQENAAAAAAAPSPDTAQLQLMARDLAAMAQQVEHLKAGIAELKASQQAMARDVARTSEVKPSEVRPPVQNPRPRISAPPRAAAAPPHRPLPAYAPAQAAAPAPLPQAAPPPPPSTMPASMLPPPPPPQAATRTEDDEPIVRPPMPLR
jgi:hypothetical protein